MKFYIIIPALDRLVDFLEGLDQQQINAITDQVQALTGRLGNSSRALVSAIINEQTIKEN